MTDVREFYYHPKHGCLLGSLDGTETKYTRSDIHEAEIAKLRNALDVAEKALENINNICGTVNFSSHNQMREAIEGAIELSDEALTAIKQARGEGNES